MLQGALISCTKKVSVKNEQSALLSGRCSFTLYSHYKGNTPFDVGRLN
jgi:hypothetical protein